MSLKAAIIVGVVGAATSVVLALLSLRSPGELGLVISSLCYLFFFVTLLIKQK